MPSNSWDRLKILNTIELIIEAIKHNFCKLRQSKRHQRFLFQQRPVDYPLKENKICWQQCNNTKTFRLSKARVFSNNLKEQPTLVQSLRYKWSERGPIWEKSFFYEKARSTKRKHRITIVVYLVAKSLI